MAEQIFNTPGTDSFEIPAGVAEIIVECWGTGGNGGGNYPGSDGSGGGGGGAYSKKTLAVTPTDVHTTNIGGGSTWFSSTLTVIAQDGQPGVDDVGGDGGSSTSGIGDVKYSGGNGASNTGGSGGGGGGSSAGTANNGADGVPESGSTGGAGGTAPSGGGNGGAGGNNTVVGTAGTEPGGGGGGGGNANGGAGAVGRIRITWSVASAAPDLPEIAIPANPATRLSAGVRGASGFFEPFYSESETVTADKFAPRYDDIAWPKPWRPEGIYAYTEVPVPPDVVEHGWEFAIPQIQRRYAHLHRGFGYFAVPPSQDPLTTSYLTILGTTTFRPTYFGASELTPTYRGECDFNLEGE